MKYFTAFLLLLAGCVVPVKQGAYTNHYVIGFGRVKVPHEPATVSSYESMAIGLSYVSTPSPDFSAGYAYRHMMGVHSNEIVAEISSKEITLIPVTDEPQETIFEDESQNSTDPDLPVPTNLRGL